MEAADRLPFFELLDATCDAIRMGYPLSAGAKAIMFEDLEKYPFQLVKAALAAHRRDTKRGQYQPNTSHVEHQIAIATVGQWPSANEAWGRVSKPGAVVKIMRDGKLRNDYREVDPAPCLMNQVTAAALQSAMPQLEAGDIIPARVTFIATYDRLVEREKQAGALPRYWVSPGGTPEEQAAVRDEGIRLGLLNATWAPAAAPQLGYSNPPPGAREALAGFRLKSMPPPGAEE